MKPAPRNNRSAKPLSPEEQEANRLAAEKAEKDWQALMMARQKERERVDNVLDFLEIPHDRDIVDARALADILMDEEKVKVILTKVRNKAFW